MALNHSTEIQLGRIYSPLTISSGITATGNVPPSQQYDASTGLYEPDYTSTFLVLDPATEVSDPDGIVPDGRATLTNMKWTLIEDGAETSVTASTSGFSIASDGRLTVMRNCNSRMSPMTFRFEAEYLDPRNGEVHRILETHVVTCEAVSARPVLSLDTSGIVAYDPVRDGEKTRTVKASLTVEGKEVPAANREFVWQKRDCDTDNAWQDILPDSDPNHDIADYDVELNADGSELAVRLWLIGTRIDIRCYARYNPYGSPSSVAIGSRTPMATFSAARVVGRLKGQVKSPRRFRPGVRKVTPELVVNDAKGIIPDPDKVLDIEWRTAKCNAGGTVSKSAVVATGSKPSVDASFMDGRYGGLLIPAFGVKEPLAAVTVDGAVLVDGSGNPIVA